MLLFESLSIHESSSIHFTNFRSLTEPRLGVLGYVYFGGLLRSRLMIVKDIVNYKLRICHPSIMKIERESYGCVV